MPDFFNTLRSSMMGLDPFVNYDEKLNLFYDETNNVKVFKLKQNKFNNDCNRNFVLGGIALDKRISEQEIVDLRKNLYLQNNQDEFKFGDICSGSFEKCLSSKRLGIVLDFLQEKEIFIHYMTVNFLYYALADVVDSVRLFEHCESFESITLLKTTLSRSCKCNLLKSVEVLNKFCFPDLKKEEFEKFVYWIDKFLKKEKLPYHELISKKLFQAARRQDMPFITDNKSQILVDEFSHFYLHLMALFSKSNHFFDEEGDIQSAFAMLREKDVIPEEINYSFIDSKTNIEIQLSDVVVGFVSSLFHFLNENINLNVRNFVYGLDDNGRNNLKSFFRILNKSISHNRGFVNQIMELDIHEKMWELEKSL